MYTAEAWRRCEDCLAKEVPSSAESDRHLAVVDAHCHIDLYDDPAGVVREAESLGIRTIAVTNAPSVYHFTKKITAGLKYVRPAAGLHPELVHSHGHELPQLLPLLEETRYVGEIGLDYVTTDETIRSRQREVFAAIVERCAMLGGKVLTIHSRRAAAEVIAIVGPSFPGRAILHWFSGTVEQLETAAAAGFYFSVNTSMMASKNGESLVRSMPVDKVLTETDGPFVRLGKRPATPADTASVVVALARVWGIDPSEAKQRVAESLRSLVTL
jgi:TatD DNase family protein